jgi:hypothetical protein
VIQRFPLALAVAVVASMATPAFSQTARAIGSVRDTDNRPIKGATIRASNPDAYPPQIISITDDKGRFAMVGLRTGNWTFAVEAAGFLPVQASAAMRVAGAPPLNFTLGRDLGPIPDALAKNILEQVVAANTLRDEGRLDQAIAAYRDIRSRNPKLTSLNFAMAGVFRKKAAAEGDPAARRALLDLALQSYGEVLETDAANDRAKSEMEATRIEASAAPR